MDLTVIVTIAGGLVSVGATLGGWVWSLSTKLTELDANQRNYAATLSELRALVHEHDNRQDNSERQIEQLATSVKNLQESLKELKIDIKEGFAEVKALIRK